MLGNNNVGNTAVAKKEMAVGHEEFIDSYIDDKADDQYSDDESYS